MNGEQYRLHCTPWHVKWWHVVCVNHSLPTKYSLQISFKFWFQILVYGKLSWKSKSILVWTKAKERKKEGGGGERLKTTGKKHMPSFPSRLVCVTMVWWHYAWTKPEYWGCKHSILWRFREKGGHMDCRRNTDRHLCVCTFQAAGKVGYISNK